VNPPIPLSYENPAVSRERRPVGAQSILSLVCLTSAAVFTLLACVSGFGLTPDFFYWLGVAANILGASYVCWALTRAGSFPAGILLLASNILMFGVFLFFRIIFNSI